MKIFFPLGLLSLFIYSCNTSSEPKDFGKELQRQLIEAKEGTTVTIPEGTFELNRPLSFNDVSNVTIKGAGKGKTILSFKGQVEGGEGMIIKAVDGITLEGFTVADSKGDAIKVQGCNRVIMRDLEATWTGGKLDSNGGYGLYPVTCTNVLMENCEASFAMDAGIYVGQSTNVVVRNNWAHNNVAGIEIENTINADVYANKATDNAGGLLIFDMPDLPQANGHDIRVHDNEVAQNNGENFAAPGIVVSILPPGTGLLVMAHRDIEVYNNRISGHNTVSIALNSWQLTGRPFQSEAYDPFCHGLDIHDNQITMGNGPSDTTTEFGQLFSMIMQGQPAGIAYDGVVNPMHLDENGAMLEAHRICFRNNGDLPFINLNAAAAMDENGLNPEKLAQVISTDISAFDCQQEPLTLEGHDTWLSESK
ncbi:MAG: right-handed parallel beta-helix repeat-containing protein [Saprospiraceae bacterium]|nr:right-handed parallel beta-helix repeat-containing protein [Saprospiraceae bacterium]